MAVTAAGNGTQSATVTTEHTLLDVSVAGTYQFIVDTVNMVDGDVLELRTYLKLLTGGTLRVVQFQPYWDVQPTDDIIKIGDPISTEISSETALRFTLKQTNGTSRNFPWKVLLFS